MARMASGTEQARVGSAGERDTLGGRGTLLHAVPCRRGRGEGEIPNGGFLWQSGRSSDGLHHSGDNYCNVGYGQNWKFTTP